MPLHRDTLVIVDMQPLLSASAPDWLRKAVIALIEKAKAEGMAIVFLEYMSLLPLCFYGKTYEELIAAARGADHLAMRAKMEVDGSSRVADALKALDIASDRFVVCGINTHACIEATAVGLTELFPGSTVEVVAQACNDFRGNNWPRFARRQNLLVVHAS